VKSESYYKEGVYCIPYSFRYMFNYLTTSSCPRTMYFRNFIFLDTFQAYTDGRILSYRYQFNISYTSSREQVAKSLMRI